MADAPASGGSEFLEAMRQAADIMLGKAAPSRAWDPPAVPDVRAIRTGLKLSQPAFARRFGFTVSAVREWEQGRRQPEAAARVLLLVIAHNPEAVDAALKAAVAA
jgi:putative transcriptional regulator